MSRYSKQKIGDFLLLIVELFLVILGFWALEQDVSFLITKRESDAEVIKIDKLKMPDPYKITVKYYNQYEQKYVTTYVDDIDGKFGQSLPSPGHSVKIYYKEHLPKVIYLFDYKYPNGGYIVIYSIFLIILIVAIIFQIIKIKSLSLAQE